MTHSENLTGMRVEEGVPDYEFDWTFVPIAVYTFFIFSGGAFIAPVISWHVSPTFRTFTRYQKFDWTSRYDENVFDFECGQIWYYLTLVNVLLNSWNM